MYCIFDRKKVLRKCRLVHGGPHAATQAEAYLVVCALGVARGAQSYTPSRTISAELLHYALSGKAQHMLQKALQTSEAGDHAEAIQQLQKTLTKSAGAAPYVYSLLGVEYLKTGQIPEAVHGLEQAVTLLPHDASNHANLGLALACKGQYERAEAELKRALDLDPRNTAACRLLGELALSKKRAEVASLGHLRSGALQHFSRPIGVGETAGREGFQFAADVIFHAADGWRGVVEQEI
jgi:tetratricopeptide (TPR) repeat protein